MVFVVLISPFKSKTIDGFHGLKNPWKLGGEMGWERIWISWSRKYPWNPMVFVVFMDLVVIMDNMFWFGWIWFFMKMDWIGLDMKNCTKSQL